MTEQLDIDPRITIKNNVTFAAFKRLVEKRGWNPDSLASELSRIEQPKEFFNRVWHHRYADVIIPFRSALKLYFDILHHSSHKNLRQTILELS